MRTPKILSLLGCSALFGGGWLWLNASAEEIKSPKSPPPAAAPATPAAAPVAEEKEREKEPPALTTYKGRTIAQTMHWQGAPWLQRREREQEENGGLMREQLEVKPGQTVCDLGSGDGYHTLWMAGVVGETGKVYAVDIQKEMLEMLQKRAEGRGIRLPGDAMTAPRPDHATALRQVVRAPAERI